MNRRSFLQFLGLAPIAPTVIAALPATATYTDLGRAQFMDALPAMREHNDLCSEYISAMRQAVPAEWHIVGEAKVEEFRRRRLS